MHQDFLIEGQKVVDAICKDWDFTEFHFDREAAIQHAAELVFRIVKAQTLGLKQDLSKKAAQIAIKNAQISAIQTPNKPKENHD